MKKITVVKMAIAPAMIFGQIGVSQAGTCTPPCEVSGANPEIRLIDTSAGDADWEIKTNNFFEIKLDGAVDGTGPFRIEPSADSNQLILDDNGNIGINTDAPQSFNELEVAGNTGAADTFAAIAISPGGPADDSGRITVNDFTDTMSLGVRTGSGGYNNPVAIHLNAGNNMLTMDSSGRVGIGGLTIAQINSASTLHVEGSGAVSGNLFLDSTGASDDWLLDPGNSGLWFRNGALTTSIAPVKFGNGAPVDSLVVEDTSGDVGIGLSSPTADLHVRGEGVGVDNETVMRLESSIPPEMVWANTALGNEWAFRMTSGNNFNMNYNGSRKFTFTKSGNLTIVGTLTQLSDRESKAAVVPVDNRKILDAVVDLPISSWEYKSNKGVRHVGPMAQDFHAAFGLGDTPKGISSIDTGGVALAAIKGLNDVFEEKDKEIEFLKAKSKQLHEANEEFRVTNDELSARLTMLENLVNKLTAKEVAMNQ